MSDFFFKIVLGLMGMVFVGTLVVLFRHPIEITVIEQPATLKAQYVINDNSNIDRYVTIWWCGKYGNLVSQDKNIFNHAQDQAILYIADGRTIVGIKNYKNYHIENIDSCHFWDKDQK